MKAALRGLKIAVVAVLLIVASHYGDGFMSGAYAQGCSSCGYDKFLDHIKLLEGGAAATNTACRRNGCAGCPAGQFCTYDLGDGGTTKCYGSYTAGGGGLCNCDTQAYCDSLLASQAVSYWNTAMGNAATTCCTDTCFVQELAQLNYNMGNVQANGLFNSAWPAIQNFCSDPAAAVAAIRATAYYNSPTWGHVWAPRAERLIAVIEAGCGNCPAHPAPPTPGPGWIIDTVTRAARPVLLNACGSPCDAGTER